MTQKGRLNWQQLPARPPASTVWRHSQDSTKLAMENILGQLHCRCRRSCRRALSTRRQCATQTVSCVLDNKDFLYLCVLWLTVNPKLMLLSFCSLLFVNVRLYVCVCLVCWCACECLWVIAAIVWLLSGPSLRPFVFLFYQWFMRRIWRCVTYSHLRACTNTNTHTHASIQSHTHTRTQSGTCKTLTT